MRVLLHDTFAQADGRMVRLITSGGIFDGRLRLQPVRGDLTLGIDKLMLVNYFSPVYPTVSGGPHGATLTLNPEAVVGLSELDET